jgi:hypothetical protein
MPLYEAFSLYHKDDLGVYLTSIQKNKAFWHSVADSGKRYTRSPLPSFERTAEPIGMLHKPKVSRLKSSRKSKQKSSTLQFVRISSRANSVSVEGRLSTMGGVSESGESQFTINTISESKEHKKRGDSISSLLVPSAISLRDHSSRRASQHSSIGSLTDPPKHASIPELDSSAPHSASQLIPSLVLESPTLLQRPTKSISNRLLDNELLVLEDVEFPE